MMKKLKPARVDEFKKFALKGNVVGMAIGVIIGGAFGKIVTSLVNDIIMPSISMLSGNSSKNLADLTFSLSDEKGAPVIKYGLFCQTVLDFTSSRSPSSGPYASSASCEQEKKNPQHPRRPPGIRYQHRHHARHTGQVRTYIHPDQGAATW